MEARQGLERYTKEDMAGLTTGTGDTMYEYVTSDTLLFMFRSMLRGRQPRA